MTKVEELEADLRLMRGIWEKQKETIAELRGDGWIVAAQAADTIAALVAERDAAQLDAEILVQYVGCDLILDGTAWNDRARALGRVKERSKP